MKGACKVVFGWGALLAALGLGACSSAERIRVYVEPTYEQSRLQYLLGLHPEVKVLIHPGTEDVAVRMEAVPEEAANGGRRASIRARARANGYEVYAVAEFLRVRNGQGGRARWVSSYGEGIQEDDVSEILFQVVREAARQEYRHQQRPFTEVDRALHAATPAS